jgi:hypothetical protein
MRGIEIVFIENLDIPSVNGLPSYISKKKRLKSLFLNFFER